MSAVPVQDLSEFEFLAAVENLCTDAPWLSAIGASILLALEFGIAGDTRTFARVFGIAHALVLRELNALADDHGAVTIIEREPRTQRMSYELTDTARSLVSGRTSPQA